MNEPQTDRIAANLRAETARRGISKAQLADALHISRETARKRLKGESPLSSTDLLGLYSEFGISPTDLLMAGLNDEAVA